MHTSTTPDLKKALPIIELRQYLLQPGRRDDLIELFDREFVETQEAVGIDVVGQFRDLERPDYFVWLRSFADMESRRHSLTAFYGGPVWVAHRDAANATMIDSDNVLLLRPLSVDAQLHGGDPASRDHHSTSGAVVALIQHRQPGREADYNRYFETMLKPQLDAIGARTLGVYETEPAKNNFPRLPVRDADVLVWFAGFDTCEQLDSAWPMLQELIAWSSNDDAAPELSCVGSDVLRLAPTGRSLLDGTARGIDRVVDR